MRKELKGGRMTEKSKRIIRRKSRDSVNYCCGCDPGKATHQLCLNKYVRVRLVSFCAQVQIKVCVHAYESQPPPLWQMALITLPNAGPSFKRICLLAAKCCAVHCRFMSYSFPSLLRKH